jgi:DNA-binding NtrC family response regulator/tetratricopeptide (TPR) repeat protein
MRLVADRFIENDDGRIIDAATGERVVLTIDVAGDHAAQRRWAVRCDALQKLQHRWIVPLVDFGCLGITQRFEAWRCGAPWSGARAEAERACDLARRFFVASGLSSGTDSLDCVRAGLDGAAWLPDVSAGYPCEADGDALADAPLDARAVLVIGRRAAAPLAEMFHTASGPRPHIAALWGPPGSGKTVLVRQLAQVARVNGFVPVAARLAGGRYATLWHGRSLLIIDDGPDGTAWTAMLDRATRTPYPHVLLIAGVDEQRTVDGVAMDRIAAEKLAAAVHPAPADARAIARIRRAAEESGGWPGRFVRLLWPKMAGAERVRRYATSASSSGARLSRVAEQPAAYEAGDAGVAEEDHASMAGPAASTWPAPGELAALRRRIDGAVRHLAQGRHEPGIRQLRQAIGGLARRDDWIEAADGALTLSSSLLRRGRVREAQAALDEARQFARRSGRDAALIDIAVMSGEASIDLARLDDAETALTAARAAAQAAGDDRRAALASLGLGRCLFWRGQYADAIVVLSNSAGFDDAAPAVRMRRRLLIARAAVGQRDFSNAMSLVADAAKAPGAGEQPSLRSSVACAAAFVHLAVGDLDAVERDVADAIAASRAAFDPLCAVRARLMLAEAERRRGRRSSTANHLRRLASVAAVPPTIRARGQLVTDLAGAPADAEAIVARHVGATGLGALALYAPHTDRSPASPSAVAQGFSPAIETIDPAMVHDVVAILRMCQTADEERAVLKDVCGRIRQQVHATAVACLAVAAGRHDLVAADGARIDPAIAERAVTAGIAIAPCRTDDRIEAAAPIQYGGAIIGALCARWTLGSTYDLTRASSILTMAAAAVAPLLSAAAARRERMTTPAFSELRGVTPAMLEVRHAAERAAAAPFAVLIEGESGSGKELVARAIHRAGPRRDRPFCALNCAALPDDLIEAELFGHARGAFTGAVVERAGVFEEAHGGTLLLDEVGELSSRAQAKLLRVIQEGELRRVGENVSRRVDVRIVAATNRDLRQDAAAGRFRLDLLYRLDVIRVTVPPLRDRREDIAVLAEHFWRDAAARMGCRATLGAATIAALARYDWPGNVRELQNVLAALAVRSPKRGVVPPTALPPQFADTGSSESWRLEEARRTFEERFVRAALVRNGGHRGRAAADLGLTRQGLTKLMTRLGIAETDADADADDSICTE